VAVQQAMAADQEKSEFQKIDESGLIFGIKYPEKRKLLNF
jgi:hypothetical protein